jgi:hypothetical protein
MKKVFSILLIFMGSFLQAQEYYWSSYNITVADQDIETVAGLMDAYFSQEGSKNAGVSVYLFENHFFDHSVDYTHSIVFTGSLEDLSNQYAKESSADWKLFLTKLSNYTTTHSAAQGNSIASFGNPGSHPIQNVIYLDVEDAATFAANFKKYNGKYNPSDRRVTLGRFNAGRSPYGESHYVLVGVDDFKTMMNSGGYRETNTAAKKAWSEYMDVLDGNVSIIRSVTRIMVSKW